MTARAGIEPDVIFDLVNFAGDCAATDEEPRQRRADVTFVVRQLIDHFGAAFTDLAQTAEAATGDVAAVARLAQQAGEARGLKAGFLRGVAEGEAKGRAAAEAERPGPPLVEVMRDETGRPVEVIETDSKTGASTRRTLRYDDGGRLITVAPATTPE